MSRRAQEGVDWCKYCSVYPRNPCQNSEDAAECPNNDTPRTEAEQLAEYRRRYGDL